MLKNKNQDSVYLYDKSQRDLYLKELSFEKCPHEVQIYSLIDLEGGEKRLESSFWSNHLQNCKLCRKKAKKVHEFMQEVEFMIPTPELNQDQLDEWRSRLDKFVSGGPMDKSLLNCARNIWEARISSAVFDFLGVLKRPRIQMLLWATFAWFVFSR